MFSGDGPPPFGVMAVLASQETPLVQDIGASAAFPSSSGVSSSLPFGIVAALDDPPLQRAFKGVHDNVWLDWTTQAIVQQHTSPLRAGCEARRREIVVIFGCCNGLARDAPWLRGTEHTV